MENKDHLIKQGLVSVIMSNYNTSGEYLKEAVESILAQTYSDFEFIIIDDASTDESYKVIESFSDPRIKLIHNEKNMGLAASLNKALEHCRGEFIARMDTDDICLPHRFETQVKFLRENPDVIVCGTLVEKVIEKDGKQITEVSKNNFPSDMEEYRIYLLFGNTPTLFHPTAMFNHRLLLEHGIRYDDSYLYAQDYRMWVDCAWRARCAVVPEVGLKFRRHEKSASSAKKESQDDFAFRVIQSQLDALHLTLTDELKPLHFRLLTHKRRPYDIRIKRWLDKIVSANKRYKVYDRKTLLRMLRDQWINICYYSLAKHPGIKKSIRIILSVPIGRYPEMIGLFVKRKKNFKKEDNYGTPANRT